MSNHQYYLARQPGEVPPMPVPPPARPRRPFAGYPGYLAEAAGRLGVDKPTADLARAQPALTRVSSAVSQALAAPDSPGRLDTIRNIAKHVAALRVAALAAELMAAELDKPDEPADAAPPTAAQDEGAANPADGATDDTPPLGGRPPLPPGLARERERAERDRRPPRKDG